MQRLKGILKWVLILAVIGATAWGGWTWYQGQGGEEEAATSLSQVLTVERGSLTASISPTGEVYAYQQETMSFDVDRLTLTELNVVTGQQVKAGDVLARIDPAFLERAVDQAEADFLSAEASLEEALEPHTALDQQKAEVAVIQAEAALLEAQEELEETLDPDLDKAARAVRDAVSALQQARVDLPALENDPSAQEQIEYLEWVANEAEAEHGRLLTNPSPSEVQLDEQWLAGNVMLDAQDSLALAEAQAALNLLNAQHRVTQAEETLADAQEALAELQAGPDHVTAAKARSSVTQAEYDLAKAQDDLATLLAGPDEDAVQLAQARYDVAKADLEEPEAALEAATMVAPFDGTVISVGVEEGDLVSSNDVVLVLADLTDLRIEAIVDETEISQVEVGQAVKITFDAFPGETFSGEVLEVPLQGQLMQNVVTYAVPVSLEGAEGVALKSGMTANLTIVVGQKEDVLLVPTMAVQQGEDGMVVLVQDTLEGTPSATRVKVGLSDGMYTEVLQGLMEGDRVVVMYQASGQTKGMPGMGGGMRMPGMGR